MSTRPNPQTVVVALGGNALEPPETAQRAAGSGADPLESAARAVAGLLAAGQRVVVTHGNGPQVGYALLREAFGPAAVPRSRLALLVAQTQGEIGSQLAQAFRQALHQRGLSVCPVVVLTHVTVSADDTVRATRKPVGPVLHDPTAVTRLSAQTGLTVVADRSGQRLAVPSPPPLEVLEASAIAQLAQSGFLVIAGGGGGIPLAASPDWRAIDAVVDKDLTSARLAQALAADLLLILTDVDGVYVDFGTPQARRLTRLSAAGLRRLLDGGAFGGGSMEPKVQAAVAFVEATGGYAAIGRLEEAEAVSAGQSGTWVIPDREGGYHHGAAG